MLYLITKKSKIALGGVQRAVTGTIQCLSISACYICITWPSGQQPMEHASSFLNTPTNQGLEQGRSLGTGLVPTIMVNYPGQSF